jgi:hypothetical protein
MKQNKKKKQKKTQREEGWGDNICARLRNTIYQADHKKIHQTDSRNAIIHFCMVQVSFGYKIC